jgi:hypothetical protein
LVILEISGPAVESDLIMVVTRAGKPFRIGTTPRGEPDMRVYPADFEHTAGPPRPVTGVVRDRHSGKPLAGVVIDVGMDRLLQATTKKDGSYRLDSLPANVVRLSRQTIFRVTAIPPAGQPYVPAVKLVKMGRASDPLNVDFTLSQGVWAEGRVTDKRTARPVRAAIEYYADTENPNLKDFPDYAGRHRPLLNMYHTKADGSFRVPVLPGAGLLAARIIPAGIYLPQESLGDQEGRRRYGLLQGLSTSFQAVATIDAKAGVGVKCDLHVHSGLTLACKVVGPDGKPVAGARVLGLTASRFAEARPVSGAEFTLTALNPKVPRSLVIHHPDRKLGLSVEVKGAAQEPFVIRLEPTATVTGRLLGPTGKPWARQDLRVYYDKAGVAGLRQHSPEMVRSDDNGRFRVEGIIPGLRYQVGLAGKPGEATTGSVKTGLVLKPGEVRDLGDVKARLFGMPGK